MNSMDDARRFVARLTDEERNRLKQAIVEAAALAKDERFLDALCRAVWIRALQGESWAVQFIAERTEGKVKDVVDVNENAVHLRYEVQSEKIRESLRDESEAADHAEKP